MEKNKKNVNAIWIFVVAIIVIIAVAWTTTWLAREKQSEVKTTLKQIYDMQTKYHLVNGKYWCTDDSASARNQFAFIPIEVVIKSTDQYTYMIQCVPEGFFACAYDDSTREIYCSINQHGTVICYKWCFNKLIFVLLEASWFNHN